MFEEVAGELDDRTPSETTMLNSVRVGSFQYQVWVKDSLISTRLFEEAARVDAAHIWEHKGYKKVRFRRPSQRSGYWLLEVESPAGDRWMTSDTYIVQVYVAKPEGITYWG